MFNLLIVEDDFVQAQHLVNSICKTISSIRLYNIVSTVEDCINLLKEENKIDIIILDLSLSDTSGLLILKYIENNNIKSLENSIIIRTGHIDFINKIRSNPYIFSYSFKGSSTDMLIKDIQKLVDNKKFLIDSTSLQNQINILLSKLHFNFSHLGTKYLSECIYEALSISDKYNIILEKDLYPVIARKYNKTSYNIKGNIIKSINSMYYDCDEKILKEFLHTTTLSSPPTVKEFITTALEILY